MSKTALIVVDVQNDFCPGGALAVPHGDEVVAPLNLLMREISDNGGLIVVSRDWHPHNSDHFEKWPVHCVQNTFGAMFHHDLEIPTGTIRIYKGLEYRGSGKEVDGYSAFDGMERDGCTLEKTLHAEKIRHIIIGGLAIDYCVKETVLDALRLGFAVDVALYACRHLSEDTRDQAIAKMYHRGACIHNAPFIPRGR